MRLLEKKVINESVQKERQTVVESGITLAKKVDKLREELLNLEKQRADFIEGSHEMLEQAIGGLKKEKADLLSEIKEAEKQLAKLREPLDEEWKSLYKLQDEVLLIKTESNEYFKSLIKERRELQREKEWIDTLQNTAIEHEHKTYKLLEKMEQDRRETKKALDTVHSLKETKEADLFNKEVSLEAREKKLKEGQETLKKERLELNKEKKLLEIKKQRING